MSARDYVSICRRMDKLASEAGSWEMQAARLVCEVEDRRLWKAAGYNSWAHAIHTDAPWSVKRCRELRAAYRPYADAGCKPESVEKIDLARAKLAGHIVSAENREEVLAALSDPSIDACREILAKLREKLTAGKRATTDSKPVEVTAEAAAMLKMIDDAVFGSTIDCESDDWFDDDDSFLDGDRDEDEDGEEVLAHEEEDCENKDGGAHEFTGWNQILVQNSKSPWRLRRPQPHEFYVDDSVWDQLSVAQFTNQNVLIIGPSGCGKTELVKRVAAAAGRSFHAFNLGGMSGDSQTALLGTMHFTPEHGTRWKKARFISAYESRGSMILLDELNRCDRHAQNTLLPAIEVEGQRYLAMDESDGAVVAHCGENVCFTATCNLGAEYTGTSQIDHAIMDRFSSVIRLGFPPVDAEMRVLMNRCDGLTESQAQSLLQIASDQRLLAEDGEFTTMISTRSLLAAGRQLACGMPLAQAIEFCIVNRFSTAGGDASDRARLQQLVTRFAG